MISEKDYVINTFKENFSDYKNRRIILYGIGFNTRLILEECADFNILGLMDGTKAGETIYGKKILTYEEVLELDVEAIIVIARSNSAKIIYKRICEFCRQNNILLYDINKNNLFDLYGGHNLLRENEQYFKANECELKGLILNHEIISFDIFDTLLMRKVLYPQDIFDIVGQKAADMGIKISDFRKRRIEAESSLYSKTVPTIYEIYDALQSQSGITDEEKSDLISLEIAVEKQVIIRREKMAEILRFAVDCGKKVYLVSDMYLPKSILERLLSELGIEGYCDIFVSCDYRVSKCNGLFSVFKGKAAGSSYLHIGDNPDADGLFAKLNGFDTYPIKSAADMLELSSYREVLGQLNTVNDRSLVGLFISKVFNDPFALYRSAGRALVRSTYDVGYLFIAPIITNFIIWLLGALREQHYDCILFSARDGYLIQKLYDIAVKIMRLEDMPTGIYFLTSRMVCAASSMKTDEDIAYVSSLPFAYSPEKLLEIRFGLEPCEILPYSPERYPDIQTYALAHKEKINRRSKEIRSRYLEYINSLGIKAGSKIALFDFVSTGTCQMYLTDLLPGEITGLYFLNYLSDNTRKNRLSIRALFENGFTYQVQSYTFENYFFLETVVTSFDPSLARFEEGGRPVYRPETRSEKELRYLKDMHRAITDYFCEYIEKLHIRDQGINKMVTEVLFSFIEKRFTDLKCDFIDNLILLDDFGVGKIEVVC